MTERLEISSFSRFFIPTGYTQNIFFKKRLTLIIQNYMMSPHLGLVFLTVIVGMPFCRIVPLELRIMPEKSQSRWDEDSKKTIDRKLGLPS